MVVRGINLVSFSEPLQITASGAEYESLYVIWKYINGLEVFSDHFQIPFAGTFYNWAYYAFYGEFTRLVLVLLQLDDAWIPTITKLISFAGLVYGSVVAYFCFAELSPKEDANFRRLNWSLALFVFFGPLMGFFGVATAPDIWALAFDVTAILFFLRYYEKFPFRAILLTCLFAYLAWGFKQIFVYTPGVVGLYLLIKRDWKWLITFSAIIWAGWLITLYVGGDQYFKTMLQFGGTKVTLETDRLLRNLYNGLPKLAAPLLGLCAILVILGRELIQATTSMEITSLKTPKMTLFAVVGLIFVVVVSIPPSAKQAAAENYYLTMSFFMGLTLVTGTVWVITRPLMCSMVLSFMAVGWLINLVGVGSVLAGVNGKLSNQYIHRDCQLSQADGNGSTGLHRTALPSLAVDGFSRTTFCCADQLCLGPCCRDNHAGWGNWGAY